MPTLRKSYLTCPSFRDVPTELENRFLCLLHLSLCVVNELTSKRFYAILKAEKTFCAVTCGLHDMTEIYAGFVADHTFDHLRLRTTRILCREEHSKAVNPDAKSPKSPPNHVKNQVFCVWEQVQAGSTPVSRPHTNNPNTFRIGEAFGFFVSIEYPNFNAKK